MLLATLALLLAPLTVKAVQTCPANVGLATPSTDLADNGDATVTHVTTGLMWKQCSEGLSGGGCATGTATLMTYAQAESAVATVNAAKFAGHGDWRLPNYKELQSLVETGCHDPSINATRFPNTRTAVYWNNTAYPLLPSFEWATDFSTGYAVVAAKTGTNYVRLVRSGVSFAAFDSSGTPPTTASAPGPGGGSQITASVAGGGTGCGFANLEFASPSAPPKGVTFPYGIASITLYGCTGGAPVVTVTYPSPVPAGAGYWNYGPTPTAVTPHWYVFPAMIAANQAQLTLHDGAVGDDDLLINGVIKDRGGPAIADGSVAFNADVDANGQYDALTDGLIIICYLFGLTGPSLVNQALGSGATRTDPAVMASHLDDIRPVLDVDGNGSADALTDGLVVIRYLFGLRGNAVVANAIGQGAQRTTSAQVETYVQTLLPP